MNTTLEGSIAVPIDQGVTQPSSEQLRVVDGYNHRDPQLGNMWRVRDLGELTPKWKPMSHSSPQAPGTYEVEKAER